MRITAMPKFSGNSHPRAIAAAMGIAATLVAVVGARPYAGSWNDGASLATVECLVDHHTLAIDRSIFVDSALRQPGTRSPYAAGDELLNERGTLDKVYIDGRYYAAKPFVPAVLMAGEYWFVQQISGLRAAKSPAVFVYVMTLLSSGLAYVVAVVCIYELSRRVLGSPAQASALAASFGLGSVALVYSRQVNGHLPQLAAVTALFLALHIFAAQMRQGTRPWLLAGIVGSLLGLSYVFDQGVGPAILLCVVPLVVWRTLSLRSMWPALLVVLLAAAPWIAAQHWLNYHVGHTIAAVNSNPEHFVWPGSPWNAATMSGAYSHASALKFAAYSAQMLVGKKGLLLHSPLLLAAIVAWCWLLTRRNQRVFEYPEIACGLALGATMWLVYSWGSTNYSGGCISIRWLLPLLAPGYYALAVYLRQRPQAWSEVLLLSGWSMLLGAAMWYCGPWFSHVVPGYWLLVACMLLSWVTYVRRPWTLVVSQPQAFSVGIDRCTQVAS